MATKRPPTPKQRCFTLLAIGKKDLGWDDDFYRDEFLPLHGATKNNGRFSASTMDIHQLHSALEAMKQSGFKPKSKKSASGNLSNWRTARIKKITALWLALHKAGIVREPSEVAMQRWCSSLTKKAKLDWAQSADLNNCIEALKSWAKREHVELDH